MEARVREGAMTGQDEWEQFKLDYASFNSAPLKALLIKEQLSLCAYTGVGLHEEHLAPHRPRTQIPPRTDYWFKPHIEHLKSQRQCKTELEAAGCVIGRDRGQDIDYHNLVAAIEVCGLKEEHFGAVTKGDAELLVLPTDPACEQAFTFFEDGSIRGRNVAARDAVKVLRLDHATLNAWRQKEIEDWFELEDPDTLPEQGFDGEGLTSLRRPEDLPGERLREIIALMTDTAQETLPEFAFVIAEMARDALAIQQQRAAAAAPPPVAPEAA